MRKCVGGPDGRIKWRIIGTKIIFKIKVNVSRYDSWERESLLRCCVTVCCLLCFSVNQSWEFHTEDRGGRERRRKRNNNKLNRV